MSSADDGSLDGQQRLDPAAVTALYVQHGEELRRFLLGVLGDPQGAADALQAALVKALQVGHTSREESRKGWLFRVAYHEAMALRRRQAVGDRAVRRLAWTTPAGSESPDAALARWERVEAVRAALKTLPDEQRQVVSMRMHENKTFAQIAAELGIPLGTALTRMRSALAKLRKCLGDQHIHDA